MRRRSLLFIVFVVVVVCFGSTIAASSAVRSAIGWGDSHSGAVRQQTAKLGSQLLSMSCKQYNAYQFGESSSDCSIYDAAKSDYLAARNTSVALKSLMDKVCAESDDDFSKIKRMFKQSRAEYEEAYSDKVQPELQVAISRWREESGLPAHYPNFNEAYKHQCLAN